MLSVDRAASLHDVAAGAPEASAYVWPRRTRRFSATLCKLLYRWTHSRAYRHNERLWRTVSIDRDADRSIAAMRIGRHRLAIENASALLGSRTGACHLIAAGPSINTIDYGKLDLAHVMGVNGAIALQDRHDVRFDYYCIVDAGFARNRPDLVARIVQQPLVLFATPLVLWYIAQYFPLNELRCRLFVIEDVQYPAGARALRGKDLNASHARSDLVLFDEERVLGFSLDIRHGVFDGCTVAYAGLQVLHSLGFDSVYLHGVDLRNASRTPRFYETGGNMQPSALDRNFGAHIEPSFRQASTLLKQRGVRVVNLSMDSALEADIFEKRSWHSLIGLRARIAQKLRA
jgi:Kdo-III transferase WaaZ